VFVAAFFGFDFSGFRLFGFNWRGNGLPRYSRRHRRLSGFSFRLGNSRLGRGLRGRHLGYTNPALLMRSCLCMRRRRGALGFRTHVVPRFLILDRQAGAVPVRSARQRGMRFAIVVTAQLIGLVIVDRTGVGNFFGNAEFVQLVDDLARLHFQLPRQFIDSNLTHIEAFRLTAFYNRLTCHTQGSGVSPSMDSTPE
jgi:hypothetical protein